MVAMRFGVFLFAFMLAGLSNTAGAKTLKRSCKGAWMVKYEMGGKTHTLTGPFTATATGTSKGVVPSAKKARRRACEAAAKLGAASLREQQALNKVCRKHPNSRGRLIFIGGVGRDRNESRTHRSRSMLPAFQCRNGGLYREPVCGDGERAGIEECDDGVNNSDNNPNACRTNCTRPFCGDSVRDRGEECDEGVRNHDKIPDACRTNCKRAHCGDGVIDPSRYERCDDGNRNPYDGCYECERCVTPKNDMTITQDAKLCRGNHRVPDSQGNGAILVTGGNVTLDCGGAKLKGLNRKGIGVVVSGPNVVLRGCDISGFAVGVDVRGRGAVVFDNRFRGNGVDVRVSAGSLFAVKNCCNKAGRGWTEGGKPGCTSRCR